jgi:putative hemolysin
MKHSPLLLAVVSLSLVAGVAAGCAEAMPVASKPHTAAPSSMANPASAYCEEQGFSVDFRADDAGSQYGVCTFPDGSECDEWASFRGECPAQAEGLDETEPVDQQSVAGWLGHVVGLPTGSQFDDYVALVPEGTAEFGLTGADPGLEAEIVSLRDKAEPGRYVNLWGTITCGVPDYGGCQLLVTRLRYGPTVSEPEPVEGWTGILVSHEAAAQFDDYFVLAGNYPVRYGIGPMAGPDGEFMTAGELERLRNTGAPFRVWGQLICGVPDTNGCQIQVARVEVAK